MLRTAALTTAASASARRPAAHPSHTRRPGALLPRPRRSILPSPAFWNKPPPPPPPPPPGAAALLADAAAVLTAVAGGAAPGLAVGAGVNSVVFLLGIRVLLRGLDVSNGGGGGGGGRGGRGLRQAGQGWRSGSGRAGLGGAQPPVFANRPSQLLPGLTPAGVAHAWALGALTYAAFGWRGYVLVCAYFLFGSAVTKLKLAQKQAEGIAEARGGRRAPASVYGSGAAGMACAAAALAVGPASPWATPLAAGFAASFASKLADTASSEVGKAYGKTTYLATTLARVPRGTEGAVSAEGSAAGVLAAAAFSAAVWGLGLVGGRAAAACAAAAVVANAFESWLGAAAQGGTPWLTNDVVNVIQISVAAGLAVAGVRGWGLV